MTKKKGYGNDSITALKGADRVRKNQVLFLVLTGWRVASMPYLRFCPMLLTRPVLATGSLITITRYLDGSIQVDDQGRGCPVDWNETEQRYNWELVFCELYAGRQIWPGR